MYISFVKGRFWLAPDPAPGSPAGEDAGAKGETPLEAALKQHGAQPPAETPPAAEPGKSGEAADTPPAAPADGQAGDSDGEVAPEIRKVIQVEVDRVRHEMGHKLKAAEQENARLKAEVAKHATAEELQVLEQDRREQELQQKEADLARREARDYCMRAIRAAELDDGTEDSLGLVDFLTDAGNDDKKTQSNIDLFKKYLERRIQTGVDERFQKAGRIPAKSGTGAAGGSAAVDIAQGLANPGGGDKSELARANAAYNIK